MGRKPTKCPKKCSHHIFSLKPMKYSAYFTREVEVCFCPATLKSCPIFPTFNTDRKHYTSAFILPEDRVPSPFTQAKYSTNDVLYRAQHQKFCKEQLAGKSVMVAFRFIQLQPKPRSKCQYCHACKLEYTDYLEVRISITQHITSDAHKSKLRANRFSAYINDLIASNYPPRSTLAESDSHLFQEFSSHDKELITSATSIASQNSQQPLDFIPSSPFKLAHGRGAFELLGLRPELLKKTIIIEQEEPDRHNQDLEQILFKRISTMPQDVAKQGSDSLRLNNPIILNSAAYGA